MDDKDTMRAVMLSGWLGLAAAGVCCAGNASVEASASVSLFGPDPSPIAAQLRDAHPGAWMSHATDGVVVVARDAAAAKAVAEPVSFALREGARLLGVSMPAAALRVFLVDGDEMWTAMAEAESLRVDSVGMQYRNEIFLRSPTGDVATLLGRVTHEVAHVLIREACPRGVPIWLDEGVAMHIGDAVASAYARERALAWPPEGGTVVVRGTVLPDLRAMKGYPTGYTATRSWYASVQAIADWVASTLGGQAVGELLAAYCERGDEPLEKVLMDRFGVTEETLRLLEKRLDGKIEFRPESVRHGNP